ncbi:alpha-galactosidase [Streptomyces fulvoviolaceus]|uniref:alpha-galactosidase n=1 Tax=Streptomyces fulvoviolaceus TaxID=285535 RepID=UPI0021C0622E|nr:alpha-galactosidase [Streptomyces fulvoviolaceus]MCT9080306.1 alpha-galactosidase [Streptomyces fulvoviolaceus]
MPSIAHDPEHRLWVLSGPGSSYVLHLDDGHRLRGLHWGPVLTLEQAASLLERPEPGRRSFEDPADGTLDLDTAGAMRYAHAGVQVRFPDGVRDLEPRLIGHEQTEHPDGSTELVLRFADHHYPLTLDAHYRVHPTTDVIERHLVLRHTGTDADGPVTVVRADSATWVLPRLGEYRLSQVRGQWSAETQLNRTPLPYGELVLTSRRGTTGHQANPWAMVDDGRTGEDHGAVWSCALAWSGSWRLTAQRLPTERVTLSAGFGHDPVTWELQPGGELTTPVCAGAYTEGGFGAASRLWHRHVLDRILPHPDELRPVLYNSWEATEFDIDVTGQIELAERAAALGVELFVMDDGWFGSRTHDAAGLGDWTPNPARFPDGLGPLIDRVHDLGMQFGLWVEPEMVNPDSDLYRAHPDWVLHHPHRHRTEHRNQLVLNLARPDVAAWLHGQLDDLLTKNAIDFLKWDMNRPFTEAGWPGAEADPDRLWIDHVRHLYALLDRLRADHPGLRIESCSSGGGRLDLGILARTDQVWTSDNTDALDRIEIQHGFSQLYPARVMGAWVTDSPNSYTGRSAPLDFRFHTAMTGVLGIGGDLNRWTEAELARAAELVAAYKGVRHLVQLGEQYRLRPLGDGELSAVQYVARDGRECAVIALRRSRHFGHRERSLPLRALDPAARYRDTATGTLHHGAVLLSQGLPLDLPADDCASALVHLVREQT